VDERLNRRSFQFSPAVWTQLNINNQVILILFLVCCVGNLYPAFFLRISMKGNENYKVLSLAVGHFIVKDR